MSPKPGQQPDPAVEAARKQLADAYQRYSQDARQNLPPPAANLTRDDLEREYARLEKRWRLVRQQIDRAFPEGQVAESQLPGVHVELKLAAEQAARTYALLSALDRAQAVEQMMEGGKFPLLNAGPLEAARLLDELDNSRKQPPPYCYVVTAVYGPHSRQAIRAHARCGPVFRHGPPLMKFAWRQYQVLGPPLARYAQSSPRPLRLAIDWFVARPIVRAAGPPGGIRTACRLWLMMLGPAAAAVAFLGGRRNAGQVNSGQVNSSRVRR